MLEVRIMYGSLAFNSQALWKISACVHQGMYVHMYIRILRKWRLGPCFGGWQGWHGAGGRLGSLLLPTFQKIRDQTLSKLIYLRAVDCPIIYVAETIHLPNCCQSAGTWVSQCLRWLRPNLRKSPSEGEGGRFTAGVVWGPLFKTYSNNHPADNLKISRSFKISYSGTSNRGEGQYLHERQADDLCLRNLTKL